MVKAAIVQFFLSAPADGSSRVLQSNQRLVWKDRGYQFINVATYCLNPERDTIVDQSFYRETCAFGVLDLLFVANDSDRPVVRGAPVHIYSICI